MPARASRPVPVASSAPLESHGSIVGAPDTDEEVEFGATMAASNDDDCPVGADEALTRLMEGNARFLRGESRFTRASIEVFADLVNDRGGARSTSIGYKKEEPPRRCA